MKTFAKRVLLRNAEFALGPQAFFGLCGRSHVVPALQDTTAGCVQLESIGQNISTGYSEQVCAIFILD